MAEARAAISDGVYAAFARQKLAEMDHHERTGSRP